MCWIKNSETTASYLSSHNIIPSILLIQENVQVIKKIKNSVSLDVIKKKMKQKDWILIEIQEKTDGDFGLFKQIFSAILFEAMQLHIWASDRLLQIRGKFTKLNANFPKQMDVYKIERNIKNLTEKYILTESALAEPIW